MSEYIKAPDSSQPPRNADSSHRLDIATLAPDDAEYWQSIVNNNVLFMPAIIAPDEVEAAAPDYDCADGELSVFDQQLFSTNTRYSFGAVLGWIPREGYCSMNYYLEARGPAEVAELSGNLAPYCDIINNGKGVNCNPTGEQTEGGPWYLEIDFQTDVTGGRLVFEANEPSTPSVTGTSMVGNFIRMPQVLSQR